jgi:hypothetical protein
MSNPRKSKGPRTVRFLVLTFTVLVGVLFYWLLGFALKDIGSLPPPAYDAVERRHLDGAKANTRKELETDIDGIRRKIGDQQERQRLLRDSISSSQTTINQLLDIQKLSLQKGVALTEAQQKAFAENQDLFSAKRIVAQTIPGGLRKIPASGLWFSHPPRPDEVHGVGSIRSALGATGVLDRLIPRKGIYLPGMF